MITTATGGTYTVDAHVLRPGVSRCSIEGKTADLVFDTSNGQSAVMPGPADLLVTAFAACVLKNVERFSDLLPFTYESASIHVVAEREEHPPRITRLRYQLTVVTDEPARRVELLHRNIAKYGTIYNTLAAACDVSGSLDVVSPLKTVDAAIFAPPVGAAVIPQEPVQLR